MTGTTVPLLINSQELYFLPNMAEIYHLSTHPLTHYPYVVAHYFPSGVQHPHALEGPTFPYRFTMICTCLPFSMLLQIAHRLQIAFYHLSSQPKRIFQGLAQLWEVFTGTGSNLSYLMYYSLNSLEVSLTPCLIVQST